MSITVLPAVEKGVFQALKHKEAVFASVYGEKALIQAMAVEVVLAQNAGAGTGGAILLTGQPILISNVLTAGIIVVEIPYGDVDGDGMVTPNDAVLIFRRFMGFIHKFPVED